MISFKRVKVVIHGRVQGVFFRQSTLEIAMQLNIHGYVRNTYQGTVEAVFEGPEENVDKIVEWCKKGPSHAKVQKLEVYVDSDGNRKKFDSFTIARTQ